MIDIDFQKISLQPVKPNTKIFAYQDDQIVKILVSSNQMQLFSSIEETVKNSNHSHYNILPCLGYSIQVSENTTKLFVAYPKMSFSLADLISQHSENQVSFSNDELIHHFDALLSAGEYLNDLNLHHKNIKPQNILVDDCKTLKLTEMSHVTLEKIRASPSIFRAPELFYKESVGKDDWNLADIWSMGMVLLDICDPRNAQFCSKEAVKEFSYSDNIFSSISARIQNIKKIPEIGQGLSEVVELMLSFDPANRVGNFRQIKAIWSEKVLGKAFAPGQELMDDDEERKVNTEEKDIMTDMTNPCEEEKADVTSQEEAQLLKGSTNYEKKFFQAFYAKFIEKFSCTVDKGVLTITLRRSANKKEPLNLQGMSSIIKHVYVKEDKLTDDNVACLASALVIFSEANCLIVDLRGSKISDKGLSILNELSLKHFTKVTKFQIWTDSPQITELSLVKLINNTISKMTKMWSLLVYFKKAQATNKILELLSDPLLKMKDLHHLYLWLNGTKISDEGVRMFCSKVLFQKLELISLSFGISANSHISDVSLQEFSHIVLPRLTKLKTLTVTVGATVVTNAGLKNMFKYGISGLNNLESFTLGISGLKGLDDSTIEQLVETGLSNKPNLKHLKLIAEKINMTNKAITDIFYKLLPKLINFEKCEILAKGSKVDLKGIEQFKHLPFFNKCSISMT